MSNSSLVHIIDDDAAARDSLRFVLECSEIPTRTYESAAQFLRALPTLERGCIITDVQMPEMNGLELVARLKELGNEDPVIMITGNADVPMAIQALHAGVADFIEKPFSDETILHSLRIVQSRHRDRTELEAERGMIRHRLETLSGREAEVMDGLVAGKPNKIIAYELEISARTVEVYRANVMTKMGARSLSELVRMAMIDKLA